MGYKSNYNNVRVRMLEAEKRPLEDIGKLLTRRLKTKARRKTGTLRRNINYKVDGRTLYVGIKKKGFYGGFFERGTEKMEKDPFIEPTIREEMPTIKKIIEYHLKRTMT